MILITLFMIYARRTRLVGKNMGLEVMFSQMRRTRLLSLRSKERALSLLVEEQRRVRMIRST